jgi:hypothetical protein
MGRGATGRKRPCRVCRRWFAPDPRAGGRQMTCERAPCRQEWHRRACREWNRKNKAYYQENYLHKKLETLAVRENSAAKAQGKPTRGAAEKRQATKPARRAHRVEALAHELDLKVLDARQIVILKYVTHLLIRRVQELRSRPTRPRRQ